MRRTGPRQLNLVFADSPSGGGAAEPSDASERRSFLLHKARSKKTRGPDADVADTSRLLEAVASEANLAKALLNVVRNKGAPGVDGQTVEVAEARAPSIIARLRHDLLAECYRPGDVRRVWLPKPGGGQRGLGIPNVVDRTVQQAVLQVLEPIFEPTFHPSSHGFRPDRGAHTAIAEATGHLKAGYHTVVDIDLAKFLDHSSDCPPGSGKVAKRSGSGCGSLIRKPFRRPWRMWTAVSSPRLTRCNTAWRDRRRVLVASIIGTKPGGAFSTKRPSRSSVRRICQGAPGVGWSAGMKPSSIQRSRVDGARPSTSAALRTETGSPAGGCVDGL
ncbi:MAG: hypothetical protein HQL42_20865 [Alphaproteobacteria bacterium]|nr:hypothetical protein [Alphaproteobacteria bacterium]